MATEPEVQTFNHSEQDRRTVERRGVARVPIWLFIILALVILLVFTIPLMVAAGGYVYYQMSGRIAPGVQVGETRLGWMTVNEAAVELHKNWNLERRLVVSDGFQSWELSPADLGLNVNAIQTARVAFGYARRQPIWVEFRQMVHSWLEGAQTAPVVVLDVEAARAGLDALDAIARRPAQDAALSWDGARPVVIPAQLGYAINITQTLQNLEANPGIALASGYFQVSLQPLIPAVSDVSSAMAQAEQLLNKPLVLRAYDPVNDEYLSWNVPREEIGAWLKFEASENGPVIGIDQSRLTSYLASLAEGLGVDRWLDGEKYGAELAQAILHGRESLIIVSHKPTEYIVQPGETLIRISWKVGLPFWKILEANPGLDPDTLRAGQSLVIPSKDEMLPLPVIPNKRIVISLSQQRLWVYQDGNLLSKHLISTGIDRSPTQPGIFQVRTHELEAYASVWDLTMPHFLGIYEAWPGFMNGIHGLPMLSNGRRLWKNILGKPASYGCIILDLDEAEWLYNWAENGVVVEIQP